MTLVIAQWVCAVESLTFQVDTVQGAGWTASGVAIELDLPMRASATARLSRLKLDEFAQEMRDVVVRCEALEVSAQLIACPQARVSGRLGDLGMQKLSGALRYGRADGALSLQLDGIAIGKGAMRVAASLTNAGWQFRADLNQIEVEPLLKLAEKSKVAPAGLTASSGAISGRLTANGNEAVVHTAEANLTVASFTASNAEGTLASDKLGFSIEARASKQKDDWSFTAQLKSGSGQAYAQPIFLDLGVHALDAQVSGGWRNGHELSLDRFVLNHQNVVRAEGHASLDLDSDQPVRDLEMDLKSLEFPGAYDAYFQPVLLDTSFKSLKTQGDISGHVVIAKGEPRSVDLKFNNVSMDDGSRNFVLNDLNGGWHWSAEVLAATSDEVDAPDAVVTPNSSIRWKSGVLLNLDVGASELAFNTHGFQFRLLQPTSIPLLDGAIDLESFRVRNLGKPNVAFMVDATLRPISVPLLCKAFGWPEFGGRIGGTISKLRLRENVITLGTTLKAQVFDGSVSISDLKLEQPFSQWPRFSANIALQNLDLNLVTSAFSFGGMTGRLSGAIDGLKLFNWQPVAFDARLFTPPDDRSRHRISQRAVQNIGSIGGGGAGVTAALSGGVMKFFDDFNYDRLGLSCRLENEVCLLDGIAPAPNGGYYLVKGKGLPRIDVIGGAHRVDWPRLVEQLIAVTQSEGPVVQ